MKRLLSVLSGAMFCWLMGAACFAQAQAPAMYLTGNVQSDERQPLPGAAITVIHLPSGTRRAATANTAGRFVVSNLLAGGPYTIRVGEGGYQPQTLENIFLENGKLANFTVTLNRLNGRKNPKNAVAAAVNPSIALAEEAVVGGPVLITTATAPAASVAAPVKRAARSRYAGHRPIATVNDPIVPGRFDAKSGNYIYDTGRLTALKLADGNTISAVGVNSTESYLYRFVTDATLQVDTVDLTRGWYNFDRVFFDAGKATLTTESVHQLRNIAALLRAYPTVRIKLGGYTDSTGTYKVNKQVSEARARTAWASLVEMGVSPSRIEARGYGWNYAIANNETEEGRAKNRRLSVRVLQK